MVFIDLTVCILTEGRNFKKIMQLFSKVVTYLLKNVEHGIEHDELIVLMELGYIIEMCQIQ